MLVNSGIAVIDHMIGEDYDILECGRLYRTKVIRLNSLTLMEMVARRYSDAELVDNIR